MRTFVFDIETDSLDATKIHCVVIRDIEKKQTYVFNKRIQEASDFLNNADIIVGHNVLKFDIPVLKKLTNFNYNKQIFDTLVASRLLYPDIKEQDFKRKKFPVDCIGRHSLKAWGFRLGNYKDNYTSDFSEWSLELENYCIQDVMVTVTLFEKLKSKINSDISLNLEHQVADLIQRQEQHGFCFDVDKAQKLYAVLNSERVELAEEIQTIFPPLIKKIPFIPKVNNTKRNYIKNKLTYKEKTIVFNPASREHIVDRLVSKYNYKPREFTANGKPKMDDSILSKLDYPEAKILAKNLLLEKRIAQLATGKQAWMKVVKNNKIHGSCNTNSCVTSRASHSYPNLAQIPSVHVPYGKECRELFTVPKGYKLVGVDVKALEIMCLCHYMKDDSYTEIALTGDIHNENMLLAGLDSRDAAKRFYYCFLYGGGVNRIAEVTGKSVKEARAIKKRFLKNLPALNSLITRVQESAAKGYLIALDKRRIKVRAVFSALNTLLQSAGAIICKQFLVEFNNLYRNNPDVQQVVWVHDEIQIECKEELATEVGKNAIKCIANAGKFLNLRVPLTGEFKIGNNWSETH